MEEAVEKKAQDFLQSLEKRKEDHLPGAKKKSRLKLILITISLLFILLAVPLTVYLILFQPQEIREKAVGPEELAVNVTEDDKGRYGIPGEKTGSDAYCCVDYDSLEVSSPKGGYVEVDKVIIESHDHTADVGIKLDIHTEAGWQNEVDRFDVSTGDQDVCGEDGPYYPDHEAPSYTHNEPDSCYQTHTTSFGCQKIDKIKMKFYSVHLDPDGYDPEKAEKDKGEHVHIKNVIWHYCPSYELSCQNIVSYTSDWQEIGDEDWSSLALPAMINFVAEGSCDEPQGVTKAKFRINGADWYTVEDPQQKYQGHFYWSYQIKDPGSYTVEAMVYNPAFGWR